MSDETPRTAFQVLVEHRKTGVWECACGWRSGALPGAWWPVPEQHQADILAAAGLLVTPEHPLGTPMYYAGSDYPVSAVPVAHLVEYGREVAAQALRDAADEFSVVPHPYEGGVTGWLRARADRIAAGAQP